jgi:hypothetical protein
MRMLKFLAAALTCAAPAAGPLASAAPAAAPSPAWTIQSLASPTSFDASHPAGLDNYQVHVTNSGGHETDGSQITIVNTLPKGLTVEKVSLFPPRQILTDIAPAPTCETNTVSDVTTVTCQVTESVLPSAQPAKLNPGDELLLQITVATPPSASGSLINHVRVEGGGAGVVEGKFENRVADAHTPAGFTEFETTLTGPDGLPATGAASHPYQYTTSFAVNLERTPPGSSYPVAPAEGELREIEVALPPGLAGNPTAVGRCTPQQFNTFETKSSEGQGNFAVNECPLGSVVGLAMVQQLDGERAKLKAPVYNLVPPKGMPAQFGFQPTLGVPVYINTKVRSSSDYGITAYLHNVTQAALVTASRITMWGVPWDKGHDSMRGECAQSGFGLCPVAGQPLPFLRLPSSCQNPLLTTMSFQTWTLPPAFAAAADTVSPPTDCHLPPFTPTIEAKPTTSVGDSPSGLHFHLHLPQREREEQFEGLAEADLRDARVTLPRGLVVNPASAAGRGACSTAEVGLTTASGESPIHFDESPARCPDASKIGVVEAVAPAVDHPIAGTVYLAKQLDNPFGSLIAIYIVLEDPQTGIVVKLAGKVTPDPETGQLTTTVSESPQLPVEDFRFDFFDGPRAPLRTPVSCGAYVTSTEMTPWSAPQGASAFPSGSFDVTSGPEGPCSNGALAPRLNAGLAAPTAGAYSSFSLRLSRVDGTDEFAAVDVTTPTGLVAKLAGVPYCQEAEIARAVSRSAPGQGALEASQSSCPPASAIGTTTAGAGAGPAPFYTGGNVYLAGPYRGAPLSMVAVVPAVAGPFDLGVIVNRIALHVDPESAQVTARSDPLPRILYGIPLDVRDIRVNLDRPNFTLAPTSCEPKAIAAGVRGVSGASASVSNRFQVGGCEALAFRPHLSLRLRGGTKRGRYPALTATVRYPQGSNYANTAAVSVALPRSEFLAQSHIRTICTRVQFAAGTCPKGSIYGRARAESPLLAEPLTGPVYLRSSSNPLPDLVMALNGQIDVVAVARIDSHKGGIRSVFPAVPDAPLSKVVLEMPGGKKGLLENSRNVCKRVSRARVRFTAHNGRTHRLRPALKVRCKGKKRGKRAGKGRGRGRR